MSADRRPAPGRRRRALPPSAPAPAAPGRGWPARWRRTGGAGSRSRSVASASASRPWARRALPRLLSASAYSGRADQRSPVGIFGRHRVARCQPQVAQRVQASALRGLERQRSGERLRRRLAASERREHRAVGDMEGGDAAVDGDRPLDQLERLGMRSPRMFDQAEQMQGVGVLRLQRQDAAVKCRRFAPAGPSRCRCTAVRQERAPP